MSVKSMLIFFYDPLPPWHASPQGNDVFGESRNHVAIPNNQYQPSKSHRDKLPCLHHSLQDINSEISLSLANETKTTYQ